MKTLTYFALVLIGSMLMLLPALMLSPTRADTSACYSVPDADGRIACIARERRDRSMCYAIQRPDMRAICLAEVKK